MQVEETIIIGSGPCGMSVAIELQDRGKNPLIIEKGNVVNSIYNYPTHQTFFSSSDKLEIGSVPFITEKQKPVRNQALAYYRSVAQRKQIRINTYEEVTTVEQQGVKLFKVKTLTNQGQEHTYQCENIVVATGYYGQPHNMNVKGEDLNKVMHYFKEGHPYFDKDVVVIGGKNSAVDAALELHKAGANITVLYRGSEYSKSIKPWILPQFEPLVRKGIVNMEFNATVTEITLEKVVYSVNNEIKAIKNDFVFAMTGYRPNRNFISAMGIKINEETGRPEFNDETMETNIPNIYVAGVIAAGNNNNEIFIENGRFHGSLIANSIVN